MTHVTINERSNQVISLSKDKIIKVALVAAWWGVVDFVALGWCCLVSRAAADLHAYFQ